MPGVPFEVQCLHDVLEGLREGLSHFSPPSRAAFIYSIKPEDPLRVHDPQNLLRGHEPKLRELYLLSEDWRAEGLRAAELPTLEQVRLEKYLQQLAGLISFGGVSPSIFFQMWYTEHHPDICSTGPTERWLEYAARMLARNLAISPSLNIGTSSYVLQEYATHAVRDHLVDQRNLRMGWDTNLRIFPILDAVLGVSKTLEEGRWPRGELIFVEPSSVSRMDFLTVFPRMERPGLENHKHVRKLLLSVEDSPRLLVSDGRHIIGISADEPPPCSIRVDFRGSHGFLHLDNELVCSFSDGGFHSSTRRANLVQVEEALLEREMDSTSRHILFKIIQQIVHCAGEARHGCTLVVDFNDPPLNISGQKLAAPLDLQKNECLELAQSLAKIDGALHISAGLRLHGFACLLDGQAVPGENRARGARFNSALRFTAEHRDLIVVVVSSDRPVSIIQGGVELTAQCDWNPCSGFLKTPPLLEEWLLG